MNWITRIVLLTVFISVALCATFWERTALAADQESPAEIITQLMRENATLRMKLKQSQLSLAKANGDSDLAAAKMKTAISARNDMERAAGTLKARIDALSKETARLNNLTKALGGKVTDQKLKTVLTQLTDALASNTSLKKDSISLKQELGDSRLAHMETITATDRLREQLAAQKARIYNLRQDLAIAKGRKIAPIGAAKAPARPELQLSGVKILAVGENVASINAGSDNGLKKGTTLLIRRRGKLVGQLQIIEISKTRAAGVTTSDKLAIEAGDDVVAAP